jgi:pyruvate/2-oxoglutarate dehydrogenase complex dihydrolipoamide dehydrogenase (E3) component
MSLPYTTVLSVPSAMISEHLAGGDCLNVGCVPSKAIIRAAKCIAEVKRSAEYGIVLPPGEITVDFAQVMHRLREKRTKIAPADGHQGTGLERMSTKGVESSQALVRFKWVIQHSGSRKL